MFYPVTFTSGTVPGLRQLWSDAKVEPEAVLIFEHIWNQNISSGEGILGRILLQQQNQRCQRCQLPNSVQ